MQDHAGEEIEGKRRQMKREGSKSQATHPAEFWGWAAEMHLEVLEFNFCEGVYESTSQNRRMRANSDLATRIKRNCHPIHKRHQAGRTSRVR